MRTMMTAAQSPIVIPGPGLPSLESLGLTSEGIYNGDLRPSVSLPPSILDSSSNATTVLTTTPGFDSICLDQASYGAPMADVEACFLYLNFMTTTTCVVAGPNLYKQVFCSASYTPGTGPYAMIVGQNIGSAPGGTSSRWYESLSLEHRTSVG